MSENQAKITGLFLLKMDKKVEKNLPTAVKGSSTDQMVQCY